MKGTGMLHQFFRAGMRLFSICSLHTSFGGHNRRGDRWQWRQWCLKNLDERYCIRSDTELMGSSILISFIIAPTLILTVEHHSSGLLSDFGLSGNIIDGLKLSFAEWVLSSANNSDIGIVCWGWFRQDPDRVSCCNQGLNDKVDGNDLG